MRCSPASWGKILPRSFYARSAEQVARELLGAFLIHHVGGVTLAGRIVETEAYLGLDDRAAHAWHGLTGRTRVLFGPPGHAYVYLIYGMYECLNLVAESEGRAGCVLIRALEPLNGSENCSGPARLTKAMGITRAHYGADVTGGPLTVRADPFPRTEPIAASPRIGIRLCATWPLRFYLEGNPHVSCFKLKWAAR